jgi:outer membrane protein insertion porin family
MNNHDLAYNLTWRTLTDPTRMSSPSIRRQLGHNVLSALKYSYKIDRRDSHLRPMSGYAFSSTSQVSGLWDIRSLKFFRQVLCFSHVSVFGKFLLGWNEQKNTK